MKFVNLHHHSTFSFGDGYGTPDQHVARAKDLGYSAIALTEHGNVSSHFQLEKAALKAGIKPIFGIEAYTGGVLEENDERRLVIDSAGEVSLLPARQQLKFHLTILAGDVDGYRNLNRIVTQSYRDYYYHPTVGWDSLSTHSDGVFVLSGCAGSLLACTVTGGKGIPDPGRNWMEPAQRIIAKFVEVFGDRYCLEIQPFPELPKTIIINKYYAKLSELTGVPLIVTQDVHYPLPEQAEMQAALHAIHRGKHSVDDVLREWNLDVPLTLPESDNDLFYRLRETGLTRQQSIDAIETSALIAGRLNVTLPKAARLRYPITESDLAPWH